MKKNIIPMIISFTIFFIDQYTKFWITKFVPMGNTLTLNKYINISPQIIYDLLYKSIILNRLILIVLPILTLIFLIFILIKSNNFSFIQRLSLWLIIGGEFTFIVDRITRSLTLLKYIQIPNLSYLQLFNISDLAVVIGGIVMLISFIQVNRS